MRATVHIGKRPAHARVASTEPPPPPPLPSPPPPIETFDGDVLNEDEDFQAVLALAREPLENEAGEEE